MSFTEPSILQALRPRLPVIDIARLATASRETNLRSDDLAVQRVMTALSGMTPDQVFETTYRLSQQIEARLGFSNQRQVACLQMDPVVFNVAFQQVMEFIDFWDVKNTADDVAQWAANPSQALAKMAQRKGFLNITDYLWYLSGVVAYGASPDMFRRWLITVRRSSRNPAVLQLAEHIVADGG